MTNLSSVVYMQTQEDINNNVFDTSLKRKSSKIDGVQEISINTNECGHLQKKSHHNNNKMQQILDSYCNDKEVHLYNTTHGEEKKVELTYHIFTDMRCITLKSEGAYKIKVRYKYSMVEQVYDDKENNLTYKHTELKTYYQSSTILKYKGDELIIASECIAPKILKPEGMSSALITQEDIDKCFAAYPQDIDIIRLEYIT